MSASCGGRWSDYAHLAAINGGVTEPICTMKHKRKTGVLLTLCMLGCGTGAYAQGRGYYNRVATSSRDVISETSPRSSVARAGGFGTVSATSRSGFRSDSLRPYSEQAIQQAQSARPGVPRGSSWEQQEPVMAEARQMTVPTRSHNYFPTMRPGLALQQPVTLTASRFTNGHICTCGRSGMLAGAGSHR